MAIAAVVDSLDTVPESLRTEYTEKDGKFYLNLDGGDNLPFVKGLKTALDTERNVNKTAKDKVAAWERLGVSPEDIQERLETERKKAEDAALKAGKFDEVLATHLGKAKQERDVAVNVASKARDSALSIARQAIISTSLTNALTKADATAEGLSALPKLIADRVKLDFDENGVATQSILDADGKTPMVGSGAGGLATFDDLVQEAIKSFPSLFKANNSGGGGKPPAVNNGGGSGVNKKSDFKSEKERGQFVGNFGLAAYQALPD